MTSAESSEVRVVLIQRAVSAEPAIIGANYELGIRNTPYLLGSFHTPHFISTTTMENVCFHSHGRMLPLYLNMGRADMRSLQLPATEQGRQKSTKRAYWQGEKSEISGIFISKF